MSADANFPQYHQRFSDVPTGFATAVSGVMTQRLILNLRSNYARACEFGTLHDFHRSMWRSNADDMVFMEQEAELRSFQLASSLNEQSSENSETIVV